MKKERKKGERFVEKRMEWLLVADFHGYKAVNRLSAVAELVEVMASTEKRLEVALYGANKKPILPVPPPPPPAVFFVCFLCSTSCSQMFVFLLRTVRVDCKEHLFSRSVLVWRTLKEGTATPKPKMFLGQW